MSKVYRTAELWKDEEYTIVPSALYQRCEAIDCNLAVFYCRLMDDFLNETVNYGKQYFPRQKELAIKFRVDLKTVKNYLKKLEALGLVQSEENPGYANFLTVINFQELEILNDTNVKELIKEHRGQRKAERAEQQQAYNEQKSGNLYDDADFDNEPVVSLCKTPQEAPQEPVASEPVQHQPKAEKVVQDAIQSVRIATGIPVTETPEQIFITKYINKYHTSPTPGMLKMFTEGKSGDFFNEYGK